MKPISLRMQAFGPYGGVAEVDFTRLATVGLFVVSGPTGAGKTSIFDAMTYALFNELPGERSGFSEFRSDHADPSLLCEVAFVFEADGDLWRVTRTPTQERAKKRGSGMATENAKAVLERKVIDGWEGVVSSVKAVSTRCESLVGLDVNQFQRVVLLPQGQFQQVLKANSKDRRELLRTLFASSLYLNIEEQLKERAKAGEQGLAKLTAAVQGHVEAGAKSLASAMAALQMDADAQDADALDTDALDIDVLDTDALDTEALEKAGSALRNGALVQQTTIAAEAAAAADSARSAVDRADAEVARHQRRDHCRSRLIELAADEVEMAASQRGVVRANQARPIVATNVELTRQREHRMAAEKAVADAERSVEARGVPIGFDGQTSPLDLGEARSWASDQTRQNQRALEQLAAADKHLAIAAQATRVAQESASDVERLLATRAKHEAEQTTLVERGSHLANLLAQAPARRAALVAATERETHRRALAVLVDKIDELDRQLRQHATTHDALIKQSDEAVADRDAAEATASLLVDRQRAASELVAAVALRRELSAAQQAHQVATKTFEHARATSEAVIHEFATAASWRLADTLEPGKPCSVCGSIEHPAPASDPAGTLASADLGAVEVANQALAEAGEVMHAAQNEVTRISTSLGARAAMERAELEVAKAEAIRLVDEATVAAEAVDRALARRLALADEIAALEQSLSSVAAERDRHQAEHNRLEGALGDEASADLDDLVALVEAAQQQADEADAAADEQALVARRASALVTELASVGTELAAAEQRRIQASAEHEFAANEAANIVGALAGDSDHYQQRSGALAALGEALDDLDGARKRLDQSNTRVEATAEHLAAQLATSDFAVIDEALSSWLDPAEIAHLDERVRVWTKERTDLAAALAEIERTPFADVAPDLDALREVSTTQQAVAEVQRTRLSEATFHLAALDDALKSAQAVQSDVAGQIEAAQRISQLAEVCAGGGPQRRSLESWVLAAHLRDVVDLANQHLAPMSSGRYELLVSDAVDDRRSQSGLNLTVLDARSGKPRPVASLSGGETFQASLALALGLADVVSANRGGIQIDALFVDEGFGSLDADALDHAIDVLDGLRSRGSLVGVITHVEALKRALQVGIEVTRNPDGSGSTLTQLIA